MGGAARLGQYVLGVEGLALLRLWLTGDPPSIEARLDEVRRFAAHLDEPPLSEPAVETELDTLVGYGRWASTYDGPNPAVAQEERVVRPLLDAAPVGRTLDAACGTGRHAAYLASRGHSVVGVDASPEMLAQARARVPEADFRVGRLEALPLEDASVDLAVCALALTHCADLGAPLRELARWSAPAGGWSCLTFTPSSSCSVSMRCSKTRQAGVLSCAIWSICTAPTWPGSPRPVWRWRDAWSRQ